MTTLTGARVKGTVEVAPGRDLSFAEFGASSDRAVVWLHGTPGARTQIPEAARAMATREGVRIIGVDRPGIGRSTPHVYDDISGFTADLQVVLDALNVERCAVVGLSGGGPYALAAGARLRDRVVSVGSLGGVAPVLGPDAATGGVVALTRIAEPFLRYTRVPLGFGLSRVVQAVTPLGGPILDLYARFSPPADRVLLTQDDFKAVFLGDLTRQGRRQFSAPFADLMVFGRDWGFALEEVDVPVHWWHGQADNIVPFAHGEHMVQRLPHATFHPLVGGGHLAGFGVSTDVLQRVLEPLD
ncbi:MAG TPA: alpha/beta hydrolase [Protaetiibacter sp.]|nr:alpha/beta hydrolase [Protaetiibacter sp.]